MTPKAACDTASRAESEQATASGAAPSACCGVADIGSIVNRSSDAYHADRDGKRICRFARIFSLL